MHVSQANYIRVGNDQLSDKSGGDTYNGEIQRLWSEELESGAGGNDELPEIAEVIRPIYRNSLRQAVRQFHAAMASPLSSDTPLVHVTRDYPKSYRTERAVNDPRVVQFVRSWESPAESCSLGTSERTTGKEGQSY